MFPTLFHIGPIEVKAYGTLLMLGFIAEAEPDTPHPGQELEAAAWFDVEAVRAALARDWRQADQPGEGIVLPPPLSIARYLIQTWLDRRVSATA